MLEDLLPIAIESGMTYKEFLHSTPKVIRLCIEAFSKIRKNEWEKTEFLAWMTGQYIVYSIGVSFNGKKVKYPENPLTPKRVVVQDMELTDEEREEQTKMLFDRLQNMMDRHEASQH